MDGRSPTVDTGEWPVVEAKIISCLRISQLPPTLLSSLLLIFLVVCGISFFLRNLRPRGSHSLPVLLTQDLTTAATPPPHRAVAAQTNPSLQPRTCNEQLILTLMNPTGTFDPILISNVLCK
jgi:hypothetical protein